MSKADRQRREVLGRRAEKLAAYFLRLKGYKILTQRFKCKAGEIDLIARKKDVIIAVEVKARANQALAQESISAKSKQRIATAAQVFLGQNQHLQKCGLRFDAIFVIGGWRVIHEINYW